MKRPSKEPIPRLIGKANESTISFCGVEAKALLDSGSQVTTVSEDFYNSLDPRPQEADSQEIDLKGPDGRSIPYLHCIEVTVSASFLPGKEIDTLALVVPTTAYHAEVPIIIGTNVIREYDSIGDSAEDIPPEWKVAFIALHSGFVGSVRSTNKTSITLQPMEVRTVSGFVRKQKEAESAITEPADNASSKIGVCPRVVAVNKPGRNARVPVKLFNMSAKVLTIPPRALLCELQEVKVLRSCNPLSEEDNAATTCQQTANTTEKSKADNFKLSDIGVDLTDSIISEEQQDMAEAVFEKWQSVFSRGPLDLGRTDLIRHEIKLSDETPFKEPVRRISPALFDEVREHIAEMLEAEAIRPSKSPYSSNVVVVRKKDGTIRLCIDYRKLNLRTIGDAYPIPRIEDSLHLLVGSRYFTKLDLKAGYWQVELKEEDKAKTAFHVGNLGFYECNRMPFGLCNAPATFQRLMERAMGDINLRDCLIYLDDIIIFSDTFENHLDRLDAVFQRLHQYNLKLKASKCEFFRSEVTYLGHVVSEAGIKTEPEKISVLKNWPVPKCIKDVRKFLGFAGYYRRFVKGFARIVRPLNDMLVGVSTKKPTRKRMPFEWGEVQQRAFETIIEKLSNPPVLVYADYKKSFKLHTDASSSGLGAVLYQQQDGIDRVIAYASRSLKPSERTYPAHKLEFLALKWAITDKFHDYLYGASFEVVTDNNPLTYVLTTAKLDATGHRWVAALSNYDFILTYRSGKLNQDADGLSRLNEGQDQRVMYPDVLKAILNVSQVDRDEMPLADSLLVCRTMQQVAPADVAPDEALKASVLTSTDWQKGQSGDTAIARVKELVISGQKPSKSASRKETPEVRRYLRDWNKLRLRNNVLYRSTSVSGQEYDQLIVPSTIKDTILQSLHDDMGHQGRDRTSWLVKTRFFWLGMDCDIDDKVRHCGRCVRQKTRAVPAAELVNITSSAPMELVCIDYLSLEMSKGRYENILVISDHFTRYAMAVPTKNQTARTTAKVLFDNFFAHYGFPAKLHSDKAQNFESRVIKHLCKVAGIKKTRTTPYHPMGNGQVERFNQTLLQMLGTLEPTQKSDWKSYVLPLVHAYNATRHDTTGFSPFYLMFGRHPRLALDAFLGLEPSAESGRTQAEYSTKFQSRLSFAYQKASEEAARQTERYKTYYDQRVRESKLEVGDRVLIRALGLKGKVKIADDWEEMPYIVTEIPMQDIPVYKVRQEDGKGRVKTLHRNQMLPFTCLPSEPLLVAPPQSNRGQGQVPPVQPSPPISESESDSSETGDSEESADETRSAEPNREFSSHQPATKTRTQQPSRMTDNRPQRTRKPPDWLTSGQWAK